MKGRTLPAPLLILSLLAVNCAPHLRLERSSAHAWHRGDYDKAVYEAAASLRHKPDNAKAQGLLEQAYRAAVNRHEDRIRVLSSASGPARWDETVREFEALAGLSRAVRDLPPLPLATQPGRFFTIDARDYTHALADARQSAASAHYQRGVDLSTRSDIESQRQAALAFRAAEAHVPGYRDAADRFARARAAGTRRVIVVPFEDRSGPAGRYGALPELMTDEIVSLLLKDQSATEFLEVVSRDQLDRVLAEQELQYTGLFDPATAIRLGKLLGANDIITGRITQVIYTPPTVESRNIETSAVVTVRTETYTDDLGTEQKREVQDTVRATVTIHTKTTSARFTASYSVVSVQTAAVGKSESFEERRSFSGEWATWTGDKRALGDYTKLTERSEPTPPSQLELVTEAARELSRRIADGLRAYFRG